MKDDHTGNLSTEELKQRWAHALMVSESAIHQRYRAYLELKRLVERVNAGSMDVSDYYPTAVHLGTMLQEISSGFTNTVFHYFAEHIDPRKKGDVRCFRMECRQLSEHFRELDRRRAAGRNFRIIK
jgi:hypothetical protein